MQRQTICSSKECTEGRNFSVSELNTADLQEYYENYVAGCKLLL